MIKNFLLNLWKSAKGLVVKIFDFIKKPFVKLFGKLATDGAAETISTMAVATEAVETVATTTESAGIVSDVINETIPGSSDVISEVLNSKLF